MCHKVAFSLSIHNLPMCKLIHSVLAASADLTATLKLFMQLSSAMHEHDSVQDISFLLQIHRAPLHAEVLQLHVVSSIKHFGAES